MNANLWREIHGGSTHFPIVLLLASVVFDFVAWRSHDETLRRGLHAAGFGSAIIGLVGAFGAVTAGLIMTRGRIVGHGFERTHHLFVWPAVISCALLVLWRHLGSGRIPGRGLGTYLAGMSVAAALMIGAGYSGGRMLLAAAPENSNSERLLSNQQASISAGQQLFLKNCAHCHGADAHGEEGPDLHNLDWTDQQIATRIRNGKKGQMPAFAGKLSEENINDVIAYLRTLN